MNRTASYLDRLAARRSLSSLKRHAAFGIAVSTAAVAIAGWHYLFVVGANDTVWATVLVAGGLGISIARALPCVWTVPERIVSSIFQRLGSWLFSVVLTFLYFVLVTPVGLALRQRRREVLQYWKERPTAAQSMWRPKDTSAERYIRKAGRSTFGSLFSVLQYFHAGRHYILLPFLIVVLALGLVLFFVKSSALAPFIYTVF